MIVPFRGQGQQAASQPQQMPSQADLLMALATMHKQGRFTPPKPEDKDA